jgi:hypothetical protein
MAMPVKKRGRDRLHSGRAKLLSKRIVVEDADENEELLQQILKWDI